MRWTLGATPASVRHDDGRGRGRVLRRLGARLSQGGGWKNNEREDGGCV
jgi:hypothetical protein